MTALDRVRTPRRRSVPKRLVAGAVLTILLVVLALVSLVWTPQPTSGIRILLKLQPPLSSGLLGTDQLGRDVFSLLMAGAANSFAIAAAAVALGGTLGTVTGLLAAIRGGWTETLTMRGCDVLFAFPPILSAMLLGVVLGPGRLTAVVAIAAFMVPVFARVARASGARILALDYILAARCAGKGAARIAAEHVLPNIAGDLLVQATLQLGLAILAEAGLSFLGLGPTPPAPSWGRMLADARTYVQLAPWLAIAPGAAVALAVLGLNLLGDGLRDRFDPRLRGRT